MLQARERVEQIEEEKKRRIEQKLAQVDEKTEKVRPCLTTESLGNAGFSGEWAEHAVGIEITPF